MDKYITTSDVPAMLEHDDTVSSYFMFGFDELYEVSKGSHVQFVNEFAVEPEVAIQPHFHDSHEFYYVLSGQATMRIGDFVSEVHPGNLVYIPPNEPHSIFAHRSGVRCLAFAASLQAPGKHDTPTEFADWPPALPEPGAPGA